MKNSEQTLNAYTIRSDTNNRARTIKICAVGLRGMPDIMGGIEKHCEQIYPRIAGLDKNLHIEVTGRSPYLAKRRSRHKNVEIRSIWTLRNKYLETILHTFLAILYARFVARADIVHIHAIGPGLFAPLARLLGMKVLITHHGADYNRQKWSSFAKKLLRLGELLAIRASHSTIVVCASLCEELKRQHPAHAHKLVYIPNGATLEKHPDGTAPQHPVLEKFGLQPGRYILTVGRLVPEKGFQDLVKAFTRHPLPHRLVITGGTDHPDDFSRNLQAQRSDSVIFTGIQCGDALNALYANAALFVLPSYHEGLPIAALEALSFGCPVLLSDIEPNLDVKLPANCYFPVGDSDALASKIAVNNYDGYRVSTQAILARFNWDEIAQHTLQQLSGISAEPGRKRSVRANISGAPVDGRSNLASAAKSGSIRSKFHA